MSVTHDVLTTHLMCPLMFCTYIYGLGSGCFPLSRFHKALCLLEFSFSCVSTNFSFEGIIGDPLTTFNFPMSFSKLVCILFFAFFVALFIEYFWDIKFIFLSEGANIVRLWGFGDDAAG